MKIKYALNAARLARRGFRANALNLYRLSSPSDLTDYLSYIQRQRAFRLLNKEVKDVANHKFFFPKVMGEWSKFVTPNLIVIRNSTIVESAFHGTNPIRQALEHANGRLVAKPARSLRGRGVQFLRLENGAFHVDGKETTEEAFIASLDKDTLYIVCPHVQQHQSIADIFPDATATFRMLTFYDEDAQKAEIVATIARIGTAKSAPFETQFLGGILSMVDPETGLLSAALAIKNDKRPDGIVASTTHPDTGVRIEGFKVPNWENVRDTMLDLCSDLPLFEMIGWDLIVTNEGFQILEANVRPGQDVVQMHFPMLSNPRFRKYLSRKGVL